MTKEQIQASDPSYSVWVSASAGTGKTSVLTARVLRLLLDGTDPGKILCLTYTNAAAAEMEHRIKATLSKWVTLTDEKLVETLTQLSNSKPTQLLIKKARTIFMETLDVADGIKIQTIHSFCQTLMRRFPIEAGIMPHFKVMDEKTSKELLIRAQVKLLSNHQFTPEIKAALNNIFSRIHDKTFSEIIESIISDRGKFANILEEAGDTNTLKAAIFSILDVPIGQTEGDILKSAAAEENFDKENLHNCAKLLLQTSRKFIEHGRIICNWLESSPITREQSFNDYKTAFLTEELEPRKNIIPSKFDNLEALLIEQKRIYKICNELKRNRIANLSASMVDIASAILQNYLSEKADKAYLDYNDLITKSEHLLSKTLSSDWVLYKLDGGIDHILLDEAQDTSLQQWNIIDSLCKDFFSGNGSRDKLRTIFVVGDEKQSIYSFQGAAPQIFYKMRDKFQKQVEASGRNWSNITLGESFRSSPAILKVVDAAMENLPGVYKHDLRQGVPHYHIPHNKEMYGKVEIWPLIESSKENSKLGWEMPLEYRSKQDARKLLANKIAETIKGWLDSGRILASEGRPVKASDIIILLRKRQDMAEYIISSLKKLDVPVAGHDRLNITEHIAVMDLVALGNFLLLPEDDLSLACVLKSPLIGLTEEELFEITYARGNKNLWQTLKSAESSFIFRDAVTYLSNLLEKVDLYTPFTLYSYILEALDGRKKLLSRLGTEINDPVDEFLSTTLTYENLHPPTLQGFLNWIEIGDSQIKRGLEQGGADVVRVMTVHGAKGLEAPIIIMADTTSEFNNNKDAILWYESDKGDIMLWPGSSHNTEEICRSIKQRKQEEQRDEYYRLLYVAMTRAKSELYITGTSGKKSLPDGCWYNIINKALSKIGEKDKDDVVKFCYGKPSIPRKTVDKIIKSIPIPNYMFTKVTTQTPHIYTLAPSQTEQQSHNLTIEDSNHIKAIEGEIIHRLLEFLPNIESSKRLEAGLKFLEKHLKYSGTNLNIHSTLAGILTLIEHQDLKELFGTSSRSEVPIVGVIDGTVVSARIDRLCVLDDRVIIADFKTGQPFTKQDKINKSYISQLELYKSLVQLIHPSKDIECYIIWTQNGLIHKI